jgi:hypothetical protein
MIWKIKLNEALPRYGFVQLLNHEITQTNL